MSHALLPNTKTTMIAKDIKDACQKSVSEEKRLAKRRAYSRAYYAANREAMISNQIKYKALHLEKVRKYVANYRQENIDAIREKDRNSARQYRAENKEKCRMADKERYASGRKKKQRHLTECERKYKAQYVVEYRVRNASSIKEYSKGIQQLKNKQAKLRRAENPIALLSGRIRSRTACAFRNHGFRKTTKTASMLGCSWKHLKLHIERQFTKGMNWENRHLWHIDHIIPLASACDTYALTRLAHFSNLQPLWKMDNHIKSNKIVTCQPELTLNMIV